LIEKVYINITAVNPFKKKHKHTFLLQFTSENRKIEKNNDSTVLCVQKKFNIPWSSFKNNYSEKIIQKTFFFENKINLVFS